MRVHALMQNLPKPIQPLQMQNMLFNAVIELREREIECGQSPFHPKKCKYSTLYQI